MSTITNIISLLEQQNRTQKELTDYLGITKNAFTDWKSGRIKSYNKYLPQIAEFFGVSVDFLIGKEKPKTDDLTDKLLQIWKQLNDDGKAKLIDYAADLSTLGKYKL